MKWVVADNNSGWYTLDMQLIDKPITLSELNLIAKERFGHLTKAVVDLERGVMVVDAELHADQEKHLLENGSGQKNLWGINIYPEIEGEDWIEFDSMINLRPNDNNFSRGVDNEKLQLRIRNIVERLVVR